MKKPPSALTARDVMTSPLLTIREDAPLRDAAVKLSGRRMSGAPVVDGRGRPIGVVSLIDIVALLAGLEKPADEPGGFYRFFYPPFRGEAADDRALDQLTVCDIMTPSLITVPETMPLMAVARALWQRHVHRVFVTRGKKVVGVISTMDVLRFLTGGPAAPTRKSRR